MKVTVRRRAWPVYLLFISSGFSALVYETLWLRMFAFYCGNTTFATTAVLTAFMAGLGIGSYLLGRRADISPHPLRLYAVMELAIAIYALMLPDFIFQFKPYFGFLTSSLQNHFFPLNIGRFFLVFFLLIFPTCMMGGTLPALVKALGGERAQTARRLAWLYAMNTLGGVAGTAFAGFHAIGGLGLTSTQRWAIVINLAVAGLAYLLSRVDDYSSIGVHDAQIGAREKPPDSFLLVSFGLAGFAALAYEVLCLRLLLFLLPYGYNNIYVFATVLVVFLSGIVAGSLLIARWIEVLRNPLRTLAILQIVLGFTAAASLPLLSLLLRFAPVEAIPSFSTRAAYSFLFCFVVMFIPTSLMGASLPIYGRLSMARYERLGTDVGRIYAANTLGNIAGAFLGGFILIPFVGIQRSFALVGLVYLLVGVVMVGASDRTNERSRYRAFAAMVGAAALIIVFVLPFPHLIKPPSPFKLLHYSEGISSTLMVLEDGEEKVLQVNDFVAAGTGYHHLRNQRMMAYLPLLLHKDPKDVLVICLGTGTTAGALTMAPMVQNVTIVEIDEQVPEALSYFAKENYRLDLQTRKARIVIEDGRAYTEFARGSFDIITGEPLHPKRAGTINLYTKEYYENGKRRLKPGGIFAQWIPYHALTTDELLAIMKTFAGTFQNVYLWMGEQLIMIGTEQPLALSYTDVAAKMAVPEIKIGLKEVDFANPLRVFAGFLLWNDTFRQYSLPGNILTDDRPHLEFSRDLEDHNVLQNLFSRRQSILNAVEGIDARSEQVTALYDGHVKCDEGIAAMLDDDYAKALGLFEQSEALLPGDPHVTRCVRLARSALDEKRAEEARKAPPAEEQRIMPDRGEEGG